MGPLVAAALAGGAGGFGPALVFASAAVALGDLLIPAVGLVGARGRAAKGAEAGDGVRRTGREERRAADRVTRRLG